MGFSSEPENIVASRSLSGRRIGLLTTSASRAGGGVFEAVVAQAEILTRLGAQPMIFALEDEHSASDAARFGAVPVKTVPVVGPRTIGYAPALVPALLAAQLDCLHLHGIWMYPSRAAAVWAKRTGRPLLISPHGMLDPWIIGRGRWKKAIARVGYERSAWQRAYALHALTTREAQDILRETGRSDSIVVPNAGPAPNLRIDQGNVAAPPRTIAYIGRIHPKKNVVALVEAWRQLAPTEARLVIAGWGDEAHIADLRAALEQAPGSVSFIGPTFGQAKQNLLESASFTILPSHSEGLPMSILEGWAAGLPAIMTQECNLPEGFAAGAALPCGYDADAIAGAIKTAIGLDEPAWGKMAAAARSLALGRFSAAAVASQWAIAYAVALGARGNQKVQLGTS